MGFRPKRKQPEFADLKGILAQGKETDNAVYQTVQEIIERLTQMKDVTEERIADINNSINSSVTTIINQMNSGLTYLTWEDEKLKLPNSRKLEAGTGITFDDTVPNIRTVNSSGGSGDTYDAPLTDGDLDEASLIFADGECIIVQVPNP